MFGQWLYKNKKMYEDLKEWMPEFHKTGAKLFVQLTAGFGRSFTISEMMEKLYTNKALRVLSKPFMDLDKITATASPSPNRWSDKVPSREMTREEIHEFVEAFAKSAKLLQDAGVDGVEIHAVHEGYLLDQFTLKYVNHRTDEYGGSSWNLELTVSSEGGQPDGIRSAAGVSGLCRSEPGGRFFQTGRIFSQYLSSEEAQNIFREAFGRSLRTMRMWEFQVNSFRSL